VLGEQALNDIQRHPVFGPPIGAIHAEGISEAVVVVANGSDDAAAATGSSFNSCEPNRAIKVECRHRVDLAAIAASLRDRPVARLTRQGSPTGAGSGTIFASLRGEGGVGGGASNVKQEVIVAVGEEEDEWTASESMSGMQRAGHLCASFLLDVMGGCGAVWGCSEVPLTPNSTAT